MAKISVFSVGYCTHPACVALKGSGFQSRCFPSRAFLIETRDGYCLWDTGYASRFKEAVSHGVNRLYGWITPVFFDEVSSLSSQLASAGIALTDIRHVVMSHFHADHIAGIRDFPHAKLYCCSVGWDKHRKLSGISALRRGFLPELMPSDTESQLKFYQGLSCKKLPSELSPFNKGWDLLGNGEILIVPLPGHALGHLGAFVLEDSGWTLIASDAAWAAVGYQKQVGPSELSFLVQENRAHYYATLSKLHLLHQSGRVKIELTHEVYSMGNPAESGQHV